MDRILINDLLKIPDCDIGKTRLKLNVFNGNTPYGSLSYQRC